MFLQGWKGKKETKSIAPYNIYKRKRHSHKSTQKAHKIKANITLELFPGCASQHLIPKMCWLKTEAIILLFLMASVGREFEKVHLDDSSWGCLVQLQSHGSLSCNRCLEQLGVERASVFFQPQGFSTWASLFFLTAWRPQSSHTTCLMVQVSSTSIPAKKLEVSYSFLT